MRLSSERGYINVLLIPLIAAVVLLIAAASFGAWAFSSRGDYKDHSDKKAAAAAAAAVTATQASDAVKYAEAAKNPLKTFVGPEAFGSVTVQYPKTWSAYIIQNTGSTPLNGFFHPDVVPDVSNAANAFSLRLSIVQSSYDAVVAGYSNLVSSKKLVASPYSLPKVPSVVGTRFDGQITQQKQGSVVILPLRNVTLQISTESVDYIPDFNNIILPNLTFSP